MGVEAEALAAVSADMVAAGELEIKGLLERGEKAEAGGNSGAAEEAMRRDSVLQRKKERKTKTNPKEKKKRKPMEKMRKSS